MEHPPDPFSLEQIEAARNELGRRVRTTPTWRWTGREIEAAVGFGTEVHLKLELFQYAGTLTKQRYQANPSYRPSPAS